MNPNEKGMKEGRVISCSISGANMNVEIQYQQSKYVGTVKKNPNVPFEKMKIAMEKGEMKCKKKGGGKLEVELFGVLTFTLDGQDEGVQIEMTKLRKEVNELRKEVKEVKELRKEVKELRDFISTLQTPRRSPVTFSGGWKNYSSNYDSVNYRKDMFSKVVLEGFASGKAATNLDKEGTFPTVFILPRGYRPPSKKVFQQNCGNQMSTRVDILPSGAVKVWNGKYLKAHKWLSFEGISFYATR